MTKLKAMVGLIMQKAMFMRVVGKATRLLGRAPIMPRMVQSTMGSGLMTSRMEAVLKRGRTVQSLMVSTRKATSMAKEIFIGPMDHIMTGSSLIMTFMAMDTTYGAINVNTKVSGAEI